MIIWDGINWNELAEWVGVGGLFVGVFASQWRCIKLGRRIDELEGFKKEWEGYRNARHALLENLRNPDANGFTEERVTAIRQARAANRTTMPRADAGPPAIVHRPKALRTKLPTRWSPPADYSERLRRR